MDAFIDILPLYRTPFKKFRGVGFSVLTWVESWLVVISAAALLAYSTGL